MELTCDMLDGGGKRTRRDASTSGSSSTHGIDFCSGGLFSSEFLDSRGKVATSVSTRRGVGSRCEHVERAV